MENATENDMDFLEVRNNSLFEIWELQYMDMDNLYMQSTFYPLNSNLTDNSQGHGQLENTSQPEPLVSFPSIESVTYTEEQVTHQHNPQSAAEGSHCETDRNSIKEDLKEAVGIVRLPLTDFNRSESFENAASPLQERKSQPKEYICDICNRSYSRKGTLTIHKRSHSGKLNQKISLLEVKPYPCKKCDASFTQKCDLERHDRTHTGDRPFVCKACGTSFAQTGTLIKHQRKHTGEKLLSCQKCSRKFSQSSNMRVHEGICRNHD